MFSKSVYVQRRRRLRETVGSGLILLGGNDLAPMNYEGNPYPFRQDSTFLYTVGLDDPGLAAVIDLDAGTECVFGDDPTVEEIVWTGPQTPLREKCERVGIAASAPRAALAPALRRAVQKDRPVHFLPPYRPEQVLKLKAWLGLEPVLIRECVSLPLIRAVVAQRSIKSNEEIEEIEAALAISHAMHTTAMAMAKPGVVEREIAGAIEGLALSAGVHLAFQPIVSVHGETLHNPFYGNTLQAGDIVVNDSGAESTGRYASDITRTIPVGGSFSQKQREIYAIVLAAQEKAIAAVRPGVEFRDIHRLAAVTLVAGLKDLGLTRGDPEAAVAAGVHTLFFQCGLGHMMGLDVHDMEPLGEDYVGYTDTIRRNPDFGWRSLRLAKALEPGYVITVEPGLYFIPALIDRWKAEKKCEAFVDYARVEAYRDFGGVRIEDDVIVTAEGGRVLGPPIPKTIADVETLASA